MSINDEIESSRQLKMGALMAYVTIAVNMLSGLFYTPWMINHIGQSGYGLYTLSTSLIGMFVVDFGLSTSVTRFLSKYNATGDQQSINNLLGIIYKLFILIDTLTTICLMFLFFFISNIYKELSAVELDKLRVVFIICAAYSILALPFSTLNGIMISYEKFVLHKACDLFNRVFTILIMVISLSLGLGLYSLVTVNAISGGLTILLKIFIIKKKTPVKVNFRYQEHKMFQQVLGFSLWSTVSSIAERFIFNIIPTILGAFAGTLSIANFGIASTLEGYVYTLTSAISGMFLPKVSRIMAKEEKNGDILPLMIKVGRILFFIAGLVIIEFFLIGKTFIFLWMGEDFAVSYYCTVFLILPSLFELPQQIAHLTVIAVNKVKLQSCVYIAMAMINVFLSVLLSGHIGELGASISICTAYLFRFAAMNVIYYRVLKINIFQFFKECYLKIGLAFFLTGVIFIPFNIFITISGWFGFLLKAMIIAGINILLNWFFTLNHYEKDLFLSAFKKLLNYLHQGIKTGT